MLTEYQMKAAMFARSCNGDPNLEGGTADAIWDFEYANAYAEDEHGQPDDAARRAQADEAKQMYLDGVKILKDFSLRYTSKRPVGVSVLSSEIEGADAYITVDAGHIATSAQVCTAIFRKRQ